MSSQRLPHHMETNLLLHRIYDVISHAWAKSTKETYGSGLLVFHVFYDSKSIPEAYRAPANSELISAFLSALAGLYSGSTISNYLHGIKAWHIIHGLNWSLIDDEINALLKAAISLTPLSSKRPPRDPYTVNIITQIADHLDLTNPLHVTVFSCLTTTFFATTCAGEFTITTLSSFDPKIHVKPSNVSIQHDCQGLKVHNFHLPCTKLAPLGEDVNWAKQHG
ncbi:hypothetical protein PAXRUDRAFT_19643 [Paxillus rubicundulus Ve08.2h10]|uniref:Uncharacterized protein n=1 Tax=Paxillus rubicundulus Ve08.2h10 TaxID=930991 RepID=A0A0D0BTB0_9AGAM|nr:hypothetical protein PAXRUDRAFT_19643 [Paxillus rubicundulus Ve08.2h10]